MIRALRPLLAVLPLLVACGGDPPAPVVQSAPAPPAPAAVPDAPAPADPFGYYFLAPEKPQPEWAKTIDHLHLSTIDMKGEEMVTVPLWGFIRPKSGDDFRLVNVRQERSRLTFSTQEVGGISYELDGHFHATGSFPENPPDGVVLFGKLRQRQGGRVTGEMDASFLYEAGD